MDILKPYKLHQPIRMQDPIELRGRWNVYSYVNNVPLSSIDLIGLHKKDIDPQKKLMDVYPGKLILELPGAPGDLGIQDVEITIPDSMECPEGTK